MLTAVMGIVVRTAATRAGGAPRCGGGAPPAADEAVEVQSLEAECLQQTGAQTTGSRSEPEFKPQ